MESILDAIQEGRLFELPDIDKTDSLQFLAHILEAIPSVPSGTKVVEMILEREKNVVTALGKGFACPHARLPFDEDLICTIGWSPKGINYGSPDNIAINIVIMYLVPDNQRNHYLKEVSTIAKILQNNNDLEKIRVAKDLNEIRDFLLDLVTKSKSIIGSETRAKMIQLEARGTIPAQKVQNLSNVIIEPVTIVAAQDGTRIILAQDKALVELLDKSVQLIESINAKGTYEQNGWRIVKRDSELYQFSRTIYNCIAVKLMMDN